MLSKLSTFLLPLSLFSFAAAQAMVDLEAVGALTSLSAKTRICNVIDYGAFADDKTDIGPAIGKVFASCANFPGGTGGVGYIKDALFENFWAYDTTYVLDIDQYWESHTTPNTGAVEISGLTFNNWTGTVGNGIERGPIVIRESDIVTLTDISLSNFNMWAVNGGKILNQCKNVYGSGYCVAKFNGPRLEAFTTAMTITTPPPGHTPAVKPKWALEGFGVTEPIPVYTPVALWALVSPLSVVKTTATAALTSTISLCTGSASPVTSSVGPVLQTPDSIHVPTERAPAATLRSKATSSSSPSNLHRKFSSFFHYSSSLISATNSYQPATSNSVSQTAITPPTAADTNSPVTSTSATNTHVVMITSTLAVIPTTVSTTIATTPTTTPVERSSLSRPITYVTVTAPCHSS